LVAGCSAGNYEIPIETPLTPKLDISKFQRVLIAGFVSGGSEDVDANLETARLLRSQLRRSSVLEVIDADVMPLLDIADEQIRSSTRNACPTVSPRPLVPMRTRTRMPRTTRWAKTTR
jgi:hypothetical protein